MTQTIVPAGFTQAAFDAFLSTRHEPAWLTELRRESWEAFQAMPLPGRDEEEWRRTDIRLLRLDKFGLPGDNTGGAQLPLGVLTEGVTLGGRTATLNSIPVEHQLERKWADRGVVFGSLDKLVSEHSDLIQRHLFTRAVNPRADKFAALHAACWSGGTFLYVPPGVTVDEPLYMLSAMQNGGVDLSHTLVIVDKDAEVTLLAETAGDDTPSLHCGAIELWVGAGARLQYVNLQNWGSGTWHFGHQKALVDRDAQLQWTIGALGARVAKVNQHVGLIGPYATAQVNGVMFTEGRQHLSYHTLQHHEAENCKSDLLYKGALQDHSRVVWRGMIKVDPNAQKTDGYQRDDNLILSEGARADSIPGLEIEADDVRCTHGSTSGRVDEQQLFYAQTRGYTRREAVRMIVTGFFQQVFDRIRIESVREALGHAIGRRIREYD